ncbi:hypothetical protein [Glaciihabitans sp. dw_435]|uniref:hypothetical protein n=1 Tax=Glaciihabitans sp. dw_435 TaxID=2720081 RepID=UPI001BD3C285|nr:hypothetical protein [Glaciihabitans sp. dw_435]
MNIDIPTVPVAIIALLGLFAPYAIAVVNQPRWTVPQRKIVSVVVSLLISAIALVIYYAASGDPIPAWWALLLLGLVVSQASYTLVTKKTAAAVESATSKPIDAGTATAGVPVDVSTLPNDLDE